MGLSGWVSSDNSLLSRSARSSDLQTLVLVTALDARVRLGTHEDHRITFANMAFTDDPGVQRQAARRIGGQYREGPWDRARAYRDQEHRRFKRQARIRDRRSGFRKRYRQVFDGRKHVAVEVLCQPEVRADPEHRGEGLDQFPIDPDLETASEKYSR